MQLLAHSLLNPTGLNPDLGFFVTKSNRFRFSLIFYNLKLIKGLAKRRNIFIFTFSTIYIYFSSPPSGSSFAIDISQVVDAVSLTPLNRDRKVGIIELIEINISTAKPAESGQKISARRLNPAANGSNGNGNGSGRQNGSNGNGSALTSRYSEQVLSNVYLASYVFYTFLRGLDGAQPEVKFTTRLRLSCKRVLDVLLSGMGLILLSPLFLMLAVLIKLDSEGPVFYKQERIGQNRRKGDRRRFQFDMSSDRRLNRNRRREDYFGVPFTVYKFRTMHKDAEKKCGPIWATKDDPRVTRIGRLLRKTRLDELPQLWNVFKGEMSLVGPRPERLYFVRKLAPQVRNYTMRLTFKPGITGLAQVEKGYDSSVGDVNKKLKYDLLYINNWSLWKDIKILVKTTLVVITGKGAF